MRIAIEATLLCQSARTGLGVYLDRLLKALASVAPVDMEFVLLYAGKQWTGGDYGSRFRTVSYHCTRSQFLSIITRLNAVLRREKIDVFHAPANTGLPPRTTVPAVVTVHDLFPLTRPAGNLKSRFLAKILYAWALKGARRIICNSRYTQAQVVERGADAARTTVIYPGAERDFSAFPAGEPPFAGRKYFLCVGALEARKGQVMLARAYAAANVARRDLPDLLFVGPDRGDGEKLRVLAARTPQIRWPGYVSEHELANYYRYAAALVFPSFDEGFGIPVIEALGANIPVWAADIPVLREIAAGRAHFIPPAEDAWRDAFLDWENAVAAARNSAGRNSTIPPPDFSWQTAARETAAVYTECYKQCSFA